MTVAGVVIVRASAAGVSASARRVAVRLEVPLWLVALFGLALTAGATAWFASSPQRRRCFGDLADSAADELGELLEEHQQACRALKLTSIQQGDAPTVASRLARVLGLADRALLAQELRDELERGDAEEPPSIGQLRTVLEEHPAFVPSERHRWQLGRARTLTGALDP